VRADRRFAEYGDGWIGFDLTPDEAAPEIKRIEELLKAAGRKCSDAELAVSPYMKPRRWTISNAIGISATMKSRSSSSASAGMEHGGNGEPWHALRPAVESGAWVRESSVERVVLEPGRADIDAKEKVLSFLDRYAKVIPKLGW
jgi:hypothetical protein